MKKKPVVEPKRQSDMYLREVIKKEKTLFIEHFRSQAHLSDNPLVRAVNVSHEVDTSTLFPPKETLKRPAVPNVVSDRGGEFILSRGALPHQVHANYASLPTVPQWKEAERRQLELQKELKDIERALSAKEAEMKLKYESSTLTSKLNDFHPGRIGTAPIVGSTFKFHGTDGKSTSGVDFQWPEMNVNRIRLKNTQYGLCTHVCDVPGGNLNIRHGAGRKTTHKPLSPG